MPRGTLLAAAALGLALEFGGDLPAGGILALGLPGPGQGGAHHRQDHAEQGQDAHDNDRPVRPGSPRHGEALRQAAARGKPARPIGMRQAARPLRSRAAERRAMATLSWTRSSLAVTSTGAETP